MRLGDIPKWVSKDPEILGKWLNQMLKSEYSTVRELKNILKRKPSQKETVSWLEINKANLMAKTVKGFSREQYHNWIDQLLKQWEE